MKIPKQPRILLRQGVVLLQMDSMTPLSMVEENTQIIEHGEVELVPTWILSTHLFGA